MGAINQLSQAVNCHINQSKAEMASPWNEIELSTTAVQRDIDIRKKKVAAVIERIDYLTELMEKEKQDRIEETMKMVKLREKKVEDKFREKEE